MKVYCNSYIVKNPTLLIIPVSLARSEKMKTNLLIIPIAAFLLCGCSNNKHIKPVAAYNDTHYCRALMAKINSAQTLRNNRSHTAITKSGLLREYRSIGCSSK
jgi:hypothetical protein